MKREKLPCEIAFMQLNGGKVYRFNETVEGNCHDCEDWDNELVPYRYEPSVLLCEGCVDERMDER
jgi:hypothetical protein